MTERSEQRARLFKIEARSAGEQLAAVPISEIAEEIGFYVPFWKELLSALVALARREELFINFGVAETGHRPTIQTQGARSEHQVGALQRGVAQGGDFNQLRIVGEYVPHGGTVREQSG